MFDRLVELLHQGHNVILHAMGGAGKSHLVKQFMTETQGVFENKLVYHVASTGVAALGIAVPGIPASTLHRWAGVGKAESSADDLVIRILKYGSKDDENTALYRWMKVGVLIIDEISMMGRSLFDKLDKIAQSIRGNKKPFGGIQLVLTGDFLQLPPVNDKWVFTSEKWASLQLKPIVLRQPKRFTDPQFFSALMAVRVGALTPEYVAMFQERIHAQPILDNGIVPTTIHSRKPDVATDNLTQLQKLPGEPHHQLAKDFFVYKAKKRTMEPAPIETIRLPQDKVKACMDALEGTAPKILVVKEGAQVMLKANLDLNAGLANGSRGVVTKIHPDGMDVKFMNGQERKITDWSWEYADGNIIFIRKQIPLILAWASTIHNCVSGNTLVYSQGVKRIDSFTRNESRDCWQDLSVPIQTADGVSNTNGMYIGETQKTIIVKTRYGCEIEATPDHRLLVRRDDCDAWVKMENLKQGDYVHINLGCQTENASYCDVSGFTSSLHKKSASIPKVATEDLCNLVGLLIGDGSYNKNHDDYIIEYSSVEPELHELFAKIVQQEFGLSVKYSYKKNGDFHKIYFCRKLVREFLLYCGLDYATAYNKKIPWIVMENKLSCQIACLRGLYDTDGGCNNSCIHYTTASETLAKQIQALLMNCGILARRYNLREGYWRVDMTGNFARLFVVKIGFSCIHKKAISEKRYGESKAKVLKTNIAEIPGGVQMAVLLQQQMDGLKKIGHKRNNHVKKHFGNFLRSIANGTTQLRYWHLEYIINYMTELEKTKSVQFVGVFDEIKHLKDMNIIFEPIQFLTHGECQVYDFCVPTNHTYIANGFTSHNCQGCTIDCAQVDISNRIFEAGQAYVALSRARCFDGLFLQSFVTQKVWCDREALAYVKQLEEEFDSTPQNFFTRDVYKQLFGQVVRQLNRRTVHTQ
jgi:ATP-dependent DNA helicase PIF1